MNYQRHYNLLMRRASSRVLNGFVEHHHIVPRCMGGSDSKENIAVLTSREHFVAHQLLVKLNPGNHKLVYAALAMTMVANSRERVNNRLYGWLRNQHRERMRERMLGNQLMKGKRLSEKHMEVLRQPKSEEHKRKIGEGNLGKTKGHLRGPQTEDHKRKKGEARALAWQRWRESKEASKS